MTASEPKEALRRIAAYAVITDESQQVLLVRASPLSGTPGIWSLPGGAVAHGEHPNETVVRETAAESGLSVAVTGLKDVLAD
ncbi:MAG TPA: NUDIX hydrolase, partial [Micromonosporaceae bacterium]|nr:NUDIX hydrolase [Micromonosporaceae bacterium]